MAFTPSPQQAAFFDWIETGTGSCILEAVAGSGKTTTLLQGLSRMKGDIFFGAYNKAISEEIRSRAGAQRGLIVSTFHAAGFQAWGRVARNARVDGSKCRAIFRERWAEDWTMRRLEGSVLKLVSYAKQSGMRALDNAPSYEDLIEHFDVEVLDARSGSDQTDVIVSAAEFVLDKSIRTDSDVVDFDDMLYAPLLHNVELRRYHWVLVDEAQDLNATRRALALRMMKPGSRLVAVGDRHQAIYGFTGADANSLQLTGDAVSACYMPLTVTYRCPKKVVEYAQGWVHHIQAAPTAPEGSVTELVRGELGKSVRAGDAVLCRFSAPLLEGAYALISDGIPARVEGRDIGDGLRALATRWKVRSLTQLSTYLDTFVENESAKLRAKDKERQAASLEDKVSCLRILIGRTRNVHGRDATVDHLTAEIDKLFVDSQDGSAYVTFSTIHKSKGREWSRVFWLVTGPSGWARQPWELEQEDNLCYVAATRAKSDLILVK